ncbi:MAG: DUF433 domain-containing protein [Saprospiraceae bacterium]
MIGLPIKKYIFVENLWRMEFKHIVSNPGILGGKPVIRGSRISVQVILEWLASGATIQDIVRKYPHLTEEGVKEAILYASNFMANEILIEVEAPLHENL